MLVFISILVTKNVKKYKSMQNLKKKYKFNRLPVFENTLSNLVISVGFFSFLKDYVGKNSPLDNRIKS